MKSKISADAYEIIRQLQAKGYFGPDFLNKENVLEWIKSEAQGALDVNQPVFRDDKTGEDLSTITLDCRRIGRSHLMGVEITLFVHHHQQTVSLNTIWLHYGNHHSKMFTVSEGGHLSNFPSAIAFERECLHTYGNTKRTGRSHGNSGI